MDSSTEAGPDQRPAWFRALLWVGILILLAIGLPLTGIGLIGLGDATGRGFLCLGLVVLVCAGGGIAREVAERRPRPDPRLEPLSDGETALFLPRASAPSRIASFILAGLGIVSLLGALFTALQSSWGWTGALAVVGCLLLYVAAPHCDSLAGGLWFTPARMVHEHDGLRWEVPWEDVTGAVHQHQPLVVTVRPDRLPGLQRTGPRGRAWKLRSQQGLLGVDTRHMRGGNTLSGYIISKALVDPVFRTALGTAESLPPRDRTG